MPRARDNPLVRYVFLAGALALIAALFWVGSQPFAVGLFPSPLDKLSHFAFFGILSFMLWLSVLHARPLLVITLVSAIGAADEYHQIFLPGRLAGLDDLATDVMAALVVTSLLAYARRREV